MDSPCHWNSSQATHAPRQSIRPKNGQTVVWLVTSARAVLRASPPWRPPTLVAATLPERENPVKMRKLPESRGGPDDLVRPADEAGAGGRRPALASGSPAA